MKPPFALSRLGHFTTAVVITTGLAVGRLMPAQALGPLNSNPGASSWVNAAPPDSASTSLSHWDEADVTALMIAAPQLMALLAQLGDPQVQDAPDDGGGGLLSGGTIGAIGFIIAILFTILALLSGGDDAEAGDSEPPSEAPPVPTPALLPALLLFWMRSLRQQKQMETSSETSVEGQ